MKGTQGIGASAQLLWASCALEPEADSIADLVDVADLEVAVQAAIIHRVGPLLWRGLSLAGRLDAIAPGPRDQLAQEVDLRRLQASLLLPRAVATAVEPLTAVGFEPVIFKGPALAARYPDPGLRPMDDIDVVLAPDEHDEAVVALRGAGWQAVDRNDAHEHYDTVLYHPGVPDLALELHRGLGGWREWSCRLTSVELWRERSPLDLFGTVAYGIPPELELVALAAHAGKPFHTFSRLVWSVDLAVVVATAGDGLDWDDVARRTERAGCPTAVAIGLRHARRLGAEVPDELLGLPASRVRRAALEPLLSDEWPVAASADTFHRLRYALPDGRRNQLQVALREITGAGPAKAPQAAVAELGRAVRRVAQWRSADAPDRLPARG